MTTTRYGGKLTRQYTLDDIVFNPGQWIQLIKDTSYVDVPIPEGYCVVEVGVEIAPWIEQQDISLWKPIDFGMAQYIISKNLYTMMILKYS